MEKLAAVGLQAFNGTIALLAGLFDELTESGHRVFKRLGPGRYLRSVFNLHVAQFGGGRQSRTCENMQRARPTPH